MYNLITQLVLCSSRKLFLEWKHPFKKNLTFYIFIKIFEIMIKDKMIIIKKYKILWFSIIYCEHYNKKCKEKKKNLSRK